MGLSLQAAEWKKMAKDENWFLETGVWDRKLISFSAKKRYVKVPFLCLDQVCVSIHIGIKLVQTWVKFLMDNMVNQSSQKISSFIKLAKIVC